MASYCHHRHHHRCRQQQQRRHAAARQEAEGRCRYCAVRRRHQPRKALVEQAKAAEAALEATAATPAAADAAPSKRKRVSTVSTNAAAVDAGCTQPFCDTLEEVLRATALQADGTTIVDALRSVLAADASGFEVRALCHLAPRVAAPRRPYRRRRIRPPARPAHR